MAKLFHPLLTMIASATDRELAKHVQFLKEENKILGADSARRFTPGLTNVSGCCCSGRRWVGRSKN